MSRIQDIINQRTKQNKRFRFTLLAPDYSGVHLLKYAPDGFAKGKVRLARNKTYRGLFRTLSVNELVFYKDGKDILQAYYEQYGVDVLVQLKVEILTKTGYQDYATLKIDFATYMISDISVKVQAIDSGFIEKVKNRDDVEVNLFNDTSIDGDTLTSFPVGLGLVDTSIDNNASFSDGSAGFYPLVHIVPLTEDAGSDFPETVTPTQNPNSKDGGFFKDSLNKRILNISGHISGHITNIGGDTGIYVDYELKLKVYNSNNYPTQVIQLGFASGTDNLSFDFNYDKQITLNKTDTIILQGEWHTDGTTTDFNMGYSKVNQTINETYQGLPVKTVQAFGIYEAFSKNIQILTGVEDCFYSETFGRTDTPITTYAQDGILLHLIKGKLLRDISGTIPIKLKDLFNAVNSVYNIGMTYENGKIRVETIDYFFDNTVILDVSDRVTNDIIEKSVDPTKIYKTIEVGFSKFGSNEDNSGFEFNTKSVFTTEFKSVLTKLSIISPYRADGSSIIRLANDTDLSKDANGDNDIFLLKSTRNGDNLIIETNEEFTSITGAVYAEKSLNLDLAPARSLRRWGNIIHAGLINGSIRWQDTKNNADLSTQKASESTPVTEDADVNYTDLATPLFYPEKYKLAIPLTNDEINTIFVNPNGMIRISDTKTGWIDEMEIDNESGLTTLTLIRNYA